MEWPLVRQLCEDYASIKALQRTRTLQRARYCQLIRDATKIKRFEYAQRVMESGDAFHNVIFSDECSISLAHYRCTCYWKLDERTKRKPKPKEVHVRAGISRHGATEICIFDGIMDADLFCNITTLVPFIRERLPDHRFMQDNNPKIYLQTSPTLTGEATRQARTSGWKRMPDSALSLRETNQMYITFTHVNQEYNTQITALKKHPRHESIFSYS